MKKVIFLHPFLFALYTVLFLYANNQGEFRLQTIFAPICIALLFATFVFFLTTRFVQRIDRAALIASLVIFTSLSYVRFADLLDNIPAFLSVNVNEDFFALAVIGIVFFISIKLLYTSKKDLSQLNKGIFILILGLVLFSLFNIVSFEIKNKRIFTEEYKASPMKIAKVNYSGSRPDIYYFIFDRYGGPRGLSEQYNFNNSPFLSFLKGKGFYVVNNATTNYPKTAHSLTSSLNMEYLDFMTKQTNGGATPDESLLTPYIRNNQVVKFLKERGYKYINVGSWWEATSMNQNADKNYMLHYGVYPFADEFTTGYLNITIAAPILKASFRDPTAVSSDPQNNLHRRMILYEFDTFKEIPQMPGPKFVFAHILIPHDPFVLDQNCQPISEDVVDKKQHQENYINQLKCGNKKIEILINQILKNSKKPPVIIVQADEGPFPMNYPLPPLQSWATAPDGSLREKFPILDAYYFPGASTDKLYQTMTPVNSFRILFNTYFGTTYPLLEDRNYIFQDENNYYKFTDVTDKVKF